MWQAKGQDFGKGSGFARSWRRLASEPQNPYHRACFLSSEHQRCDMKVLARLLLLETLGVVANHP